MKKLKYTSKRGKTIIFDSFEENENWREECLSPYWVGICPHCHNKYKGILGYRVGDGGSGEGSCGVLGCENTNACYYVDFEEDDVKIVEERR